MDTNEFLKRMQEKCRNKARQMAALELSIWDERHEHELKTHFGFTDKALKERKEELLKDLQ